MRFPASSSQAATFLDHEMSGSARPRHPTKGDLATSNDRWDDELFRELDGFEHAWIAAGSLVAVGLLALAALAVFGIWVSLGVLLFGTALAVSADLTLWMPGPQSRERIASRPEADSDDMTVHG